MRLGLYGKLPSQGDFIGRRLPWEFTSGWDDWLQAGLMEAKRRLGDAWLNRYLTAPIWRFQLAPGVLGTKGWIGLWFPSVDRVGRHFPLTLAAPLPTEWMRRYAVLELDATMAEWESVALRALEPQLDFDSFDALIGSLPFAPRLHADEGDRASSEPVIEPNPTPAGTLIFDAAAQAASILEQLGSTPVQSCFFTWGGEAFPPTLCRSAGLMSPALFHEFLLGSW